MVFGPFTHLYILVLRPMDRSKRSHHRHAPHNRRPTECLHRWRLGPIQSDSHRDNWWLQHLLPKLFWFSKIIASVLAPSHNANVDRHLSPDHWHLPPFYLYSGPQCHAKWPTLRRRPSAPLECHRLTICVNWFRLDCVEWMCRAAVGGRGPNCWIWNSRTRGWRLSSEWACHIYWFSPNRPNSFWLHFDSTLQITNTHTYAQRTHTPAGRWCERKINGKRFAVYCLGRRTNNLQYFVDAPNCKYFVRSVTVRTNAI